MGCVYSKNCIGELCAPRDIKVRESENVKTANTEISVFSPADDSDSDEGETRDHLHELGSTEVGITRLSRVSAQFLPPDGSRTVKVPSGSYELRYSFLSQRGYYPDALDKANQDSFCIHTPFGTNPDDNFFGVFDGHGEFGAQCSQFVKQKLCENLLRNSRFHMDAVEACYAAFLTTNLQLHDDALDDSMSGTTAITVLVRGKKLYVANSGDSRAVIGERRGNDIVAVDLSIDQTPFRPDELERVKQCGARVLTLDQIEGLKNPDVQCWGTEEDDDDGDPPRLWVQNGMYPGTAFTRSLGDSIAESIGVVANPEIVVMELTPNHPFIVIASDGVFEFLPSQTVVDMVAKYKDPRDACAAIVAESYRLWLQYETRTDDITVIVVHINGLDDAAVGQSTVSDVILRPPLPQVVEVSGSESPSVMNWTSRNNRARHDISRARLRAIESSLENGQAWFPSSPAHRKTWEEEAQIERALRDHFLFRKLTNSQCHVLLDCMQRVEVQAGEIVVNQGGEGDCFYVVGNGEFEVLATQEEKNGLVPRVLQHYTAEKLSSFGELALMSNKPLQASVRAVTNGTLWALKREDFRGILMSEFSNLSSLKLLRSVDLLSRLTILQLSHIADSLSEVSFCAGQTIVDKNENLVGLYIVQKGVVKITYDIDSVKSVNASSLIAEVEKEDEESSKSLSLEKTEGSYFGEWTLLGEHISNLHVIAVGDVVCSILTKEKFDSIVGPLTKLSQDDHKSKQHSTSLSAESIENLDTSNIKKIQLADLEWRTCLYSTDCSEIGLVRFRDSENLFSLKRFVKHKVEQLGKEALVFKEKYLLKLISQSTFVPRVICTTADQTYAGILLDTRIACSMTSIIHNALDETSAQFCAASVVIALEDLHKNGVLYRGVSPDVLVFDHTGYIQLVDFRFGKKLSGDSGERAFTICGMSDSLAPEIIQGKGHGFPADWWALGALIYFMLQGEMPFGSWRESELTFARIVKGQLTLPETFSLESIDLITKLLEVDESARLGSQGIDSIKAHPWFKGIDWKGLADRTIPVPHDIISRINQYMESHPEDVVTSIYSPTRELEELSTPEWLEDW
ncbi:hypothetical protein ACJIZ3_021210 [Penstemon smallii]|uniref:protein-serine/threonine phosphatase n=1 Tax=Penstemon smallii TaxID=265156 RepID=A0ABD3SLB7_9LAMI